MRRASHLIIDKPPNRPTVPEVAALLAAYGRKPGNGVGGSLHIVVDDGNVSDSDLHYCRQHAVERCDEDGVAIVDLMLQMTKTQRRKLRGAHYQNEEKND